MAIDFLISSAVLSSGRKVFYGKKTSSNEDKFTIGYTTMYEGNFGLYNILQTEGQIYLPENYPQYGFWSYFLYPTAMAESKGSFKCLNTYDRARFTFGFMQYAAHVPNGDFVVFLKELLLLPDASAYFPKLALKDNRIHYRSNNGTLTLLESDSSTQALMDYLNPSLSQVENQELICSARMVHWSSTSLAHRELQVKTAVEHYQKNMKSYHTRFGLHGAPAKVCALVCDIRHQGRGTNNRIAAALNTNGDYEKAYSNLCTIGQANYQSRITTVKNTIKKLSDLGLFQMKYDAEQATFVAM
ncbi:MULTISPECIES: hypothetical protein [unclassified Flavobacterium]|uniref:hypothetical protein n=1 Tax=unclassified Flavobacterium TaxID=196869 RepID=UPI0036147DFF